MAISEDLFQQIRPSIVSGNCNLLLGAGASLKSTDGKGRSVPSAGELRDTLCDLKKARKTSSLQRVFGTLSPDEIAEHVTDRFSGCKAGPALQTLAHFNWRRIFTLNIDDALEHALENHRPKKPYKVFNFTDNYSELRPEQGTPIIHLHGFVGRAEEGYVFSLQEYARQIRDQNQWIHVLTQFLPDEPFLIVGTTLEEIDIEYFLSFREVVGNRQDRGPSVLVEPYPDGATDDLCKKRGLVLSKNTAEEFLNDLRARIPFPPTLLDNAPKEIRDLLPERTSIRLIGPLSTDFEVVPKTAKGSSSPIEFLYGQAPTWANIASSTDIPRSVTSKLLRVVRQLVTVIASPASAKTVTLLLDDAGGGKTTILRRTAFLLAQEDFTVLYCNALGRLNSGRIAEALDLIDQPVILAVDNFADHAEILDEILRDVDKPDVHIVASERGYRLSHIKRVFSHPYSVVRGAELSIREAENLISLFADNGLVADDTALKNKQQYAKQMVGEEIAIAACRIMNDFQPLESVVARSWKHADEESKLLYLTAALAERCVRSGVRYTILARLRGEAQLRGQLRTLNALPMEFVDPPNNEYVVPLNATLGDRILQRVSKTEHDFLYRVAVGLARDIQPFVNRKTIMQRLPEARLASRLFDYDAVVKDLLAERSEKFYDDLKSTWGWNSRYWEQVALLNLDLGHHSPIGAQRDKYYALAQQRARQAVAIEFHPFTLTTLGKILVYQMGEVGIKIAPVFSEAFNRLGQAISLEEKWARQTAHPYMLTLQAVKKFYDLGGQLKTEQKQKLIKIIDKAKLLFPNDVEIAELIERAKRGL